MSILGAKGSAERHSPNASEETERTRKRKAKELEAAEVLSGEGRLKNPQSASTCKAKGKIHVTDGPFAESKEVIGGLAV